MAATAAIFVSGVNMNILYHPSLEDLRERARKDWHNEETEFIADFETYFRGYLAAIKRFGHTCTKPHKEPWGRCCG